MTSREKRLDEFIHEHARFCREPIIQRVLADDHWGSEALDRAFAVYYIKVRMMRYIYTLSRLYVNTFDQSNRNPRGILTLDQSIDAADQERLTQDDLFHQPSSH